MYEWDEEKSERNLEKHGLSFEDAEQVFSGPCVTFVDDRFDYEETTADYFGTTGRAGRGHRPYTARREHKDYLDEKGKRT